MNTISSTLEALLITRFQLELRILKEYPTLSLAILLGQEKLTLPVPTLLAHGNLFSFPPSGPSSVTTQ